MTSEREIWKAALLLVKEHGIDAVTIATREAERLKHDLDSDSELTSQVWSWIAERTSDILRTKPRNGEYIN